MFALFLAAAMHASPAPVEPAAAFLLEGPQATVMLTGDCANGQCSAGTGPVRRVARATVGVFQRRQPVRRLLRFVFRGRRGGC